MAEKKAKETKEEDTQKRRPTLTAEEVRLMAVRRAVRSRHPLFVRQHAHRYWRIGRWGSWRRPRGMQSKQRRHYGYRSEVVSIGYGTPAHTRGRTALGFVPVVIHHPGEMEELEPTRHLVIIGRSVGTKKRLGLEESARKKGFRIANPLARGGGGGGEE